MSGLLLTHASRIKADRRRVVRAVKSLDAVRDDLLDRNDLSAVDEALANALLALRQADNAMLQAHTLIQDRAREDKRKADTAHQHRSRPDVRKPAPRFVVQGPDCARATAFPAVLPAWPSTTHLGAQRQRELPAAAVAAGSPGHVAGAQDARPPRTVYTRSAAGSNGMGQAETANTPLPYLSYLAYPLESLCRQTFKRATEPCRYTPSGGVVVMRAERVACCSMGKQGKVCGKWAGQGGHHVTAMLVTSRGRSQPPCRSIGERWGERRRGEFFHTKHGGRRGRAADRAERAASGA